MCVVGARPNFMKIKPVMDALDRRGTETVLVHSGQHYDASMSTVFFEELGIRPPDRWLEVGSGSHAEQAARVMLALEPVMAEVRPDVVVVVGDVNSTMAAALVAAKSPARLAHVEAGLRSRDWTMPEEVNRLVTDSVSDDLLAPSADAVGNLLAEGHPRERVHLVGNVMIDTLLANVDRARARGALDRLGLSPGGYGLVTLHRPANVDHVEMFKGLLGALGQVAADCPLVLPVHPRVAPALAALDVPAGVRTIEPLGYLDFVALEASARLVLTDSGGVQEETTALGVPCLTLRDTTERPITITEGTNVVVGRDPARIVAEARRVLRHGVLARRPALWDGQAGERIADVLVNEDRLRR
ncbi:MAG TPA: UDP-N-acetylglucosamine 2-epimerase (non-hydrolyzing) [Acidimicrobiales bacterium]|nr:UDP-N-acetylglucosamine 2-epimerase (non-hydrolyzing) [Acidimicrobiales bacterium]